MEIVFGIYSCVICSIVLPTVSGCGQIPSGGERTVNFNVSNFKLAAEMAYTDDVGSRSRFPAISSSRNEAETFIRRLIMGAVDDVLYEQGRSAFLADYVISLILQQLEVQITYEPLKCQNVISPMSMTNVGLMENCIIADGTVTSICMGTNMAHCNDPQAIGMHTLSVPSKHFSSSGSLKTSNIVMANWSNQLWQSVMNRVLRKITSGPNGSLFYGASVEDVLCQQGQSAFLSDNVISLILQQVSVQITYEALKCANVIGLSGMAPVGMKENCVVADGAVTGICIGGNMDHCIGAQMVGSHSRRIPPKHFSISGSLQTSNVIRRIGPIKCGRVF